MRRNIKVTINSWTKNSLTATYFVEAAAESRAVFAILKYDLGLIWDKYELVLKGSNDEIQKFISYLKLKGLNVEDF